MLGALIYIAVVLFLLRLVRILHVREEGLFAGQRKRKPR